MNRADYIHFYTGSKILCGTFVATMVGTMNERPDGDTPKPKIFFRNDNIQGSREIEDIKLLLIPIQKLTEDHYHALDGRKIAGPLEEFKQTFNSYLPYFSTSDTWYLIKQGYDVFELIETGHAIDITTTPYGKV